MVGRLGANYLSTSRGGPSLSPRRLRYEGRPGPELGRRPDAVPTAGLARRLSAAAPAVRRPAGHHVRIKVRDFLLEPVATSIRSEPAPLPLLTICPGSLNVSVMFRNISDWEGGPCLHRQPADPCRAPPTRRPGELLHSRRTQLPAARS